MEEDDDPDVAGIARRRREHPVYRLSFRSKRRRDKSSIFFSTEVDTLFGLGVKVQSYLPWPANYFRGIGGLDVAGKLKHLVLDQYMVESTFGEFRRYFPKLETLTILLNCHSLSRLDTTLWSYVPIVLPQEVDGQLSKTGLTAVEIVAIDSALDVFATSLDAAKKKYPEWKAPTLKFRSTNQFIENEGIKFPEPPEDPLESLEPEIAPPKVHKSARPRATSVPRTVQRKRQRKRDDASYYH